MGLTFLIVSFVALLLLRVPIAISLGLSSLGFIFWFMPATVPMTIIPQIMSSRPSSFPLLAIPFFILVGELMNASGISQRLVDLAKVTVGHLVGGMGMVSVVASALMSSFSGSAVANAVGTGSITIPAMRRQGYPARVAAAIESSASSLGTVIPPSISMVVYGSLTGVSIGGLFMAGFLPGVLMVLGLGGVVRWMAKRHNVPVVQRTTLREILMTFVKAIGPMSIPLVILGGIMVGVMTPTEAGAIGVIITLILALAVYRSMKFGELYGVLVRTALTTGVILLVIATASILGYIMTYERIPSTIASAMLDGLEGQWAIMLTLVLILVVLGSFMETNAAIAIIAPVAVGVADGANIDPLFMGLIVVLSLAIGVATPPVGVCLFVTAKIARTTIEKVSVAALPFVAVLIAVTATMAVFPGAVLWLPKLLGF